MKLTEAIQQLSAITDRLESLRLDYSTTLYAEHETKVSAWFAAQAPNAKDSTTFRNNAASYSALSHTGEVMRVRGEIQAAEDRREYLRAVIAVELGLLTLVTPAGPAT